MTENTPSAAVEPYAGELVTRGDVRQDMRDRKTDSWTDVVQQVAQFGAQIAQTEFVPKALRGKPAAVVGAIMYGREIGLAPMMSLQNLHVIEGKPSVSAEGQRALVLQAGHELVVVDSTGAKCTIKGRRRGSEEWSSVTWTLDDARAAGLLHKDVWKKYARQMLMARATAELCRNMFPDVIRGLMATEELEDVVAVTDAPPNESAGTDDGPAKVQRTRKAPAKKAAPAKPPAPDLPGAQATPQTGAGTAEGPGQGVPATGDRPTVPAPPLPGGNPGASASPADEGNARPADTPASTLPPAGAEQTLPEEGGAEPTGDAPPSDPQPEPEPDADGVVDAEIVEEESPPREPGITAEQTTKLVVSFQKLGVTDRAERQYMTGVLAGREVETAKQLTKREASSVIDTLERCSTNEELQAVVNHTAEHAEKADR